MRPLYRQILSYVLLATYAGISLLGDGLHMLLPEGEHQQHHHHGIYVVGHSCHDEHHAGHDHDHGGASCGCSEDAPLAFSESDSDSHVCEICSFLLDAVSQPVETTARIEWRPLVAVVRANLQPIYSLTSLGLQAPRGPPLLSA